MAENISLNADKLFLSRIGDMVELSLKRGAVYSLFLNAGEAAAAQAELKRLMHENYCFFGGFENAERKMLCVYREYFEPENSDFPMEIITFTFRKENKLSHRDFLGAFMALGIKRETLGDIVIDEGIAQVAAANAVKDVICGNIRKIGSVGVKNNENFSGILTKTQDFKRIEGTAASMRLDAIAGLAVNLSRSKAAEIIKAAGAEVNFIPRYDCSFTLKEGDVFSIRGYGKFRLSEASGITKKGRIHVAVLKYY